MKIKNILEQKLIRSEKITIQLMNNSMHLKTKRQNRKISGNFHPEKENTINEMLSGGEWQKIRRPFLY